MYLCTKKKERMNKNKSNNNSQLLQWFLKIYIYTEREREAIVEMGNTLAFQPFKRTTQYI